MSLHPNARRGRARRALSRWDRAFVHSALVKDALAVHGGALGAAMVALAADAVLRRTWGLEPGVHWGAAALMYATVATLVAALGLAGWGAALAAEQRLARVARRAAPWVMPAAAAAVAGAAVHGTAHFLFSGAGIQDSGIASWGPYVVIAAATLSGALLSLVVRWGYRAGRAGVRWIPAAIALVLVGGAAALVAVDLTVYVALYSRLHTALETVALVALAASGALVLRLGLHRFPGWHRVLSGASLLALLASLSYVSSASARNWTYESLQHAWREPVYVGRMLSRAQIAESFVDDPTGWKGEALSSLERLRRKYDFTTTTRSPIWDEPFHEPADFEARLDALRERHDYNILVYYVDTLRHDVASDPKTMPNAVQFATESLSFRRAYATGSNTLHSLPGLTGGSYDLQEQHPHDMLRVARRAGMRTVLFAAQSAREFLGKLLPSFEFEETIDVADYARGNREVWGYGADQPTAPRLVDRTLEWVRAHREERFLAWVFNFDVHNWRELDEAYVRESANALEVPEAGRLNWRYRTVASAVDAQFGRLLHGIEELGLKDDTIVLFVSDHGEGLGRDGFWVHSIFLWESLVHVPLAIRVPGMRPRVIREPVSLVDVPPTLARYMIEDPEMAEYHGEDLLGYLLPERPPRRLPLVLVATQKEKPVRIGIIDPARPFKLVLPFEGAVPELYELTASDPDGWNVASEHPRAMLALLNDLVRSPPFPRVEKSEPEGEAGDKQAAVSP